MMGQRSQIIVKVPSIYYNEGNPNNKPDRIIIYHDQWLYGVSFVKWLAAFLHCLDYKKAVMIMRDWEYYVDEAVRYASNHSIERQGKAHKYSEDGDDNQILTQAKSAKEFLLSLDNNNGYIYVEIDENKNISCDILTGSEDDDNAPRRVSPRAYVEQFYNPKEVEWQAIEEDVAKAEATITTFFSIDALKRLESFRKEVANGKDK